jgi:hypothetical protein
MRVGYERVEQMPLSLAEVLPLDWRDESADRRVG